MPQFKSISAVNYLDLTEQIPADKFFFPLRRRLIESLPTFVGRKLGRGDDGLGHWRILVVF